MEKNTKVLLGMLLTAFFIFYLAVASLPSNPLKTKNIIFNSSAIKKIFPEGWAFFTKNPKEDQIYFYQVNFGKKTVINKFLMTKNFALNNIFGIKRENRFIQTEFTKMANSINSNLWMTTYSDIGHCKPNSFNIIKIHNAKINLRGYYILEKRTVLDWYYASSKISKTIPIRRQYIIIDVR